jgi:tRNA-binding protein
MAVYQDFLKIDIRTGTIIRVEEFPEALKPAYKLKIDFGEAGIKHCSAQITDHYTAADLLGKQVLAVVNFPPKQIANFYSECLVLGAVTAENKIVLIHPDRKVDDGLRIL